MKKLIIVRHGDYDYRNNDLNLRGISQIEKLSERIAQLVAGERVVILSSDRERATSSAKIIADKLVLGFTEHELLWSENCHQTNLSEALILIDQAGESADIVIVVTHYEYTAELPPEYGKRLGVSGFPHRESDKGTARVIDFDLRTCCPL